MSDKTYEIWCIVEGDDRLFSVIALSTIYIHSLKVLIKEKRSDVIQRGAHTPDLWEVRYF